MTKEEAINLIHYLYHMYGCEIVNREGDIVGDKAVKEMIEDYLDEATK